MIACQLTCALCSSIRALDSFDLELTDAEAYALLSGSEKQVFDKIARILVQGEHFFDGAASS